MRVGGGGTMRVFKIMITTRNCYIVNAEQIQNKQLNNLLTVLGDISLLFLGSAFSTAGIELQTFRDKKINMTAHPKVDGFMAVIL